MSLRKYKKVLIDAYKRYKRREKYRRDKSLSDTAKRSFEESFSELQNALLNKDKKSAKRAAWQLDEKVKREMPKSIFEKFLDFVGAIVFALVVAIVVRLMWFELYEIPTGSMRPTFKESDHLIVSKTSFGINIPFTTQHILFYPDLCKRNEVVVFSVKNMKMRDPNTIYFYLFPGKKQLIKRMVGKPGDTLYFYGGKIYGIDKDGKDISKELQAKEFFVEHIPFIRFDGNVAVSDSTIQGLFTKTTFKQSGINVAELSLVNGKGIEGKILYSQAKDYNELWGFKNFATARLLTYEEVKGIWQIEPKEKGVLYLELQHHPSFHGAKMQSDISGRFRPSLNLSSSFIPLNEDYLKKIFSNMYTARFTVKNGMATRFDNEGSYFSVPLSGIPDGRYEFQGGKAFEVKFGGWSFLLPKTHPIYNYSVDLVQKLFNVGIEFDTRFSPNRAGKELLPSRYGYFNDGDFYLLGAKILHKDDPTLVNFVKNELQRQKAFDYYLPLIDEGGPLKGDGSVDGEFIKNYGLKIPSKSYYCLGDNHAMSGDGRDFGFVPEDNLRGSPAFIFWPPGSRFGAPVQPSASIFNIPTVIIWGLAILIIVGGYWYYERKYRLPLK